jgi:hypothetical protein
MLADDEERQRLVPGGERPDQIESKQELVFIQTFKNRILIY